jgi:hypothetical protein
MELTTDMISAALQTGVNINELALLGVGAVIVVMILGILAQIGLSYLAQRNLNDQLSIGVQAIVGGNNLRIIDAQQDDSPTSSNTNE